MFSSKQDSLTHKRKQALSRADKEPITRPQHGVLCSTDKEWRHGARRACQLPDSQTLSLWKDASRSERAKLSQEGGTAQHNYFPRLSAPTVADFDRAIPISANSPTCLLRVASEAAANPLFVFTFKFYCCKIRFVEVKLKE